MKPGKRYWKLVLRLLLPQKAAQFHTGLVQLRLGSPNRAAQHPGDLFVFVSFNIVKGKDRAVSGRQLSNRFIQGYAIHDRHRIRVFGALNYLYGRFAVIRGLLHLDAAFAKMHQDLIDGQPVQPGGKGRFPTKASNFSKELDEDFLCEVFCFRDVAGHSQTQRINPAIMSLVKLLEGHHVALSRFLSESVIRFLVRLGFGCGHVFVFGQARRFPFFAPTRHVFTKSAFSKEQRFVSSAFPVNLLRGTAVALNAGVMRRFQRVVALSDPKDIEFPQPQQHFVRLHLTSSRCDRVNDSPPLRQPARSGFPQNLPNRQLCG